MKTQDKYNDLIDQAELYKESGELPRKNYQRRFKNYYECSKCKNKYFKTKANLTEHYRRRHPEIPIDEENIEKIHADPYSKIPSNMENTCKTQVDELQMTQQKLSQLIEKTDLMMQIKEKSDKLSIKEREILGLKENVNELMYKYSELQNKFTLLEETQRQDAKLIEEIEAKREEDEKYRRDHPQPSIEELKRPQRLFIESFDLINIPRRRKVKKHDANIQTKSESNMEVKPESNIETRRESSIQLRNGRESYIPDENTESEIIADNGLNFNNSNEEVKGGKKRNEPETNYLSKRDIKNEIIKEEPDVESENSIHETKKEDVQDSDYKIHNPITNIDQTQSQLQDNEEENSKYKHESNIEDIKQSHVRKTNNKDSLRYCYKET